MCQVGSLNQHIDCNPKDFIVFDPAHFSVAQYYVDNDGKGRKHPGEWRRSAMYMQPMSNARQNADVPYSRHTLCVCVCVCVCLLRHTSA